VPAVVPVLLLTLALLGNAGVPLGITTGQISLAATSMFSGAGLGARNIFYAQSRIWLFYVPSYNDLGIYDFYYKTSLDGVNWSPPRNLGLPGEYDGGALTHDDGHVYIALATTGSTTYLAYGGLYPNGTVVMNDDGGRLKLAAYEGGLGFGVRMSVGVSSEGHVFIAYQAPLECGLCVVDSAVAPYTSWTNSIRVLRPTTEYPVLHSYRPGQMLLLSGNFTSVWDNGWTSPTTFSGIGGGQVLYINGKIYLFGGNGHCQVPPLQGPGGCLGFYTFDGSSWSAVHMTNVRGYAPMTVTYDPQGDRFVIFAPSDYFGTNIDQWSGRVNADYYQNTTIASGRTYMTAIASFEIAIPSGINIGTVGMAWSEGNFPSYRVNTYFAQQRP